jgi:hypothetical protein
MEWKHLYSLRSRPAQGPRPFLALRYRRAPEGPKKQRVPPFTEIPADIEQEIRNRPGLVRRIVNFLLLFILGVALLLLVIAVAYQIVYAPHVLAKWGIAIVDVLQRLLLALHAWF